MQSKTVLRRTVGLLPLAVLFVLNGCATPEGDWQGATTVNTIQSYESYLERWPETDKRQEVEGRIELLHYQRAMAEKQIPGYTQFLANYPQSRYRTNVQQALETKSAQTRLLPPVKRVCLVINQQASAMPLLQTVRKAVTRSLERDGFTIVPEAAHNADVEVLLGDIVAGIPAGSTMVSAISPDLKRATVSQAKVFYALSMDISHKSAGRIYVAKRVESSPVEGPLWGGAQEAERLTSLAQQVTATITNCIKTFFSGPAKSSYTSMSGNDERTRVGGDQGTPECVHARHILVAVRSADPDSIKRTAYEKAKAIRQELLEGKDFGEVAAKFSDCPSKVAGGDVGTFHRGMMAKPFENAAFSQPAGDVGPIVQTDFGYHIIQVIERKPTPSVPGTAAVTWTKENQLSSDTSSAERRQSTTQSVQLQDMAWNAGALQPKPSVEISLLVAESSCGTLPLKALAPFGDVKNMMSLVKAPNAPDDALTGKTEFSERGVGMVVLPDKYVSIVVRLALSIQSKTTVKASELAIIDAQRQTHHGTLWDDGLNAWVCSDAEYEPGQYEEYVIFILPLPAYEGQKELWLKDHRIATLTSVSRRSDAPQVSAKVLAGRIIKQSPLGDSVMMQDGKLIDVGSFMTVSGNRMTIIEPKKD